MKRHAVLGALLAAALVKPAHAVTNEQVFSSSHTATADTTQSLAPGRAYLYKVVVSSAGVGGTPLITVQDINARKIAVIDGAVKGDYKFETAVSTGLVYTTAGTTPPQVTFIYRRQGVDFGSTGLSSYSVYQSTGVNTTQSVKSGRAMLKRILITKAGTSPSAVTVYDSNGQVGRIVDIINAEAISQTEYNVFLSSGITITTTGSPNVSFVYSSTR